MKGVQQQMVRNTPGQMVRNNNTPSHVVSSSSNSINSNMVKSDNTPIHMVSSSNFNSNNKSPSHMVRSIPSDQMVVRSNIPSHLMVRGNYIPSQHMLMMKKTGQRSQQHQTSGGVWVLGLQTLPGEDDSASVLQVLSGYCEAF